MRSSHEFIWAESTVNNRTRISIVTVQSLVTPGVIIFGANDPDNHIISPIRRGDKG